ncbi:MAG: TIGR00269 family protein [Methanobacterium sp. Maddingley MBC34]|nr:MAG: TIGR00269 family protein [Methanobacterium sp. Maddingley MBC34]
MKHLDYQNFNQELENKVKNVITDYNLIDEGDRVAVALSGGKDSVLTLHILDKLLKENELDFELLAIAINEGISGYREDGTESARNNASGLGVEYHEVSLESEMGFSLDEAAMFFQTACVPCGVFRRYLLNRTAHHLGVDKLATGHNLDDEVQSFLMSFARADVRRFAKFGPKQERIHSKMVPRIKPLWLVPEKEVGMWAIMNEVDVHLAECPYAYQSLRSRLKAYLNHLEEERPGTKMKLLEFFQKNLQIDKKPVKIHQCQICGEPSSASVCKACEMQEFIKNELG